MLCLLSWILKYLRDPGLRLKPFSSSPKAIPDSRAYSFASKCSETAPAALHSHVTGAPKSTGEEQQARWRRLTHGQRAAGRTSQRRVFPKQGGHLFGLRIYFPLETVLTMLRSLSCLISHATQCRTLTASVLSLGAGWFPQPWRP